MLGLEEEPASQEVPAIPPAAEETAQAAEEATKAAEEATKAAEEAAEVEAKEDAEAEAAKAVQEKVRR